MLSELSDVSQNLVDLDEIFGARFHGNEHFQFHSRTNFSSGRNLEKRSHLEIKDTFRRLPTMIRREPYLANILPLEWKENLFH